MRFGMVGLGVISRFYRGALLDPETPWTLAGVCDPREDRREPYREAGVPGYPSLEELLAAETFDAVIVNVPNDVHHPICLQALEAGRHVCCEKPLTLHEESAAELTAIAERSGLVLFTAFHRRYNSNVLRLVDEIGEGRILDARVRYLEEIREHAGDDSWYLDPARSGGGCIADNGPNAFDVVWELLGPVDVEAATVDGERDGVDMDATVRLRAREGGATATVELRWDFPGEVKDVRVELEDGRVLEADMLAGYPGFKSSLEHEYARILDDFAATVADPAGRPDRGAHMVSLVAAAYARAAR